MVLFIRRPNNITKLYGPINVTNLGIYRNQVMSNYKTLRIIFLFLTHNKLQKITYIYNGEIAIAGNPQKSSSSITF